MRSSWVWDDKLKKLVPKDEYYASRQSNDAGYYVMGDIQPYQSMATGQMVEGRRQHREHMKANGLVELGNDIPKPRPVEDRSDRRKETIARAVYEKLRY
jgi:hypothetical protein